MSNFYQLEVVGRGSETQLQGGENLNDLIWCFKGYIKHNNLQTHVNIVILVSLYGVLLHIHTTCRIIIRSMASSANIPVIIGIPQQTRYVEPMVF